VMAFQMNDRLGLVLMGNRLLYSLSFCFVVEKLLVFALPVRALPELIRKQGKIIEFF